MVADDDGMSHNSARCLTVAYKEFLKGGIQLQSIMLIRGKNFSSGKKGLYFESVLVLSIFLSKIQVVCRKKVFTLNLSLIFRISDLPQNALLVLNKRCFEIYRIYFLF